MTPTSDPFTSLQQRLEEAHQWPCSYVFKCVAPADVCETVKQLLPQGDLSKRDSAGGRFTAITVQFHATAATEVVDVYRRVSQIKGVVLL